MPDSFWIFHIQEKYIIKKDLVPCGNSALIIALINENTHRLNQLASLKSESDQIQQQLDEYQGYLINSPVYESSVSPIFLRFSHFLMNWRKAVTRNVILS